MYEMQRQLVRYLGLSCLDAVDIGADIVLLLEAAFCFFEFQQHDLIIADGYYFIALGEIYVIFVKIYEILLIVIR